MNSRIESNTDTYPADGSFQGRIVLLKGLLEWNDEWTEFNSPAPEFIEVLDIQRKPFSSTLSFRSKSKEGQLVIRSRSGKSFTLKFIKPSMDADGDLFPDEAELHSEGERTAFQRWFVRIAEAQFRKTNYGWNKDERDCSGLVRFAYREAQKRHDSAWFKKNGITIDKNLPDIMRFFYPNVPVIKNKIFKIKHGPAEDQSTFGVYADAKTLMLLNTAFISRDIRDSQPGDLLFFYDSENFKSPYHTIIVTKNDLQEIILLYHTGDRQGIKRVNVQYLNAIRKFSPNPWNKNFLGVFRFSILI